MKSNDIMAKKNNFDRKGYYATITAFGVMYIFFAISYLGNLEKLSQDFVIPVMWFLLGAGVFVALYGLIQHNK